MILFQSNLFDSFPVTTKVKFLTDKSMIKPEQCCYVLVTESIYVGIRVMVGYKIKYDKFWCKLQMFFVLCMLSWFDSV